MKSKKMTVDALFARVWRDYWFCERFLTSGHATEVKRNYEKHIKPTFGEVLLPKVTRLEVKQWHVGLIATPIAANRSLEVFSRMFNYAISEELFDGGNPCAFAKVFTEKKRRRYASEAELKKLGAEIEAYETISPRAACFLYAMLFSGARPKSLEKAKQEELEVLPGDYGRLVFYGKTSAETGEDEEVIFPPFIMEKIAKLERRKDGLIFGIKMPTEIWTRIRTRAGCPDLWARDFRRTFATVGMSNEVNMDTISELLNHKSVQTTKVYAKLCPKARIAAVKTISEKLIVILQGVKAANE